MSDRVTTSTKDISRYHIVVEDANTLIARASLGVLLRDPVDENGAAPGPLAEYAAGYWVTHARVKNVASQIRDGMERLFDPDGPYFRRGSGYMISTTTVPALTRKSRNSKFNQEQYHYNTLRPVIFTK